MSILHTRVKNLEQRAAPVVGIAATLLAARGKPWVPMKPDEVEAMAKTKWGRIILAARRRCGHL